MEIHHFENTIECGRGNGDIYKKLMPFLNDTKALVWTKIILLRLHALNLIYGLLTGPEKIKQFRASLPFTLANRSVYRLGRFGQMVSKFPH